MAFPTFLTFDQPTVDFTMTAIPEPTTAALVLVTICLAVGKRQYAKLN